MRNIQSSASWTALCAVAALAGLLVSPASAERSPANYEERFARPKNGVHLKDNNVWVYTSAFAKRFGMPARWADDTLKGAEAVAYRIEAMNIPSCGFFGEPDNCRTDYRCVFDIYLSDKLSQKLPWKTNRAVDYVNEDSSAIFLSAQSRSDQKSWIEKEQRYDRSRLNVGLDSINWVYGKPRERKPFVSQGSLRVLSYDREIFSGLDYLNLTGDCSVATKNDHVGIWFSSLQDRKAFFRGDAYHKISLPDAYMKRVNAYDRKEYAPKNLATEAEKRLK